MVKLVHFGTRQMTSLTERACEKISKGALFFRRIIVQNCNVFQGLIRDLVPRSHVERLFVQNRIVNVGSK